MYGYMSTGKADRISSKLSSSNNLQPDFNLSIYIVKEQCETYGCVKQSGKPKQAYAHKHKFWYRIYDSKIFCAYGFVVIVEDVYKEQSYPLNAIAKYMSKKHEVVSLVVVHPLPLPIKPSLKKPSANSMTRCLRMSILTP